MAFAQATAKNELGHGPFRQQFTTVDGLRLCSYTNIESDQGLAAFDKKTILVLLHGYPQSPYMWRYVAPQLADEGYPIFIPDLPGYANSPDHKQSLPQDKLSVGTTILKSLAQYLSELKEPRDGPKDIILITHDRGSRVGHRLSVTRPLADQFTIKATAIMDIVPTTEQFAGLGRIPVALGYFHWPFLANVEIATKLITAFGGSTWVRDMVHKMTKRESTKEAGEIYAPLFDDEAVIRASCRDYEAGALVDVPAQHEDQKNGKKVDIPVIVLWSEAGLGSWFEVEKVWKNWIKEGTYSEFYAVGFGAGHYIAEDAPDFVGEKVLQWLKKVDAC